MKRLLSILFLGVYLTLSIVSYISLHYCNGQLKSFAFSNTSMESCCKSDNSVSFPCCTDVLIDIDFKPDQINPSFSSIPEIQDLELLQEAICIFLNPIEDNSKSLVIFESPPSTERLALYLLHQVFLFYS